MASNIGWGVAQKFRRYRYAVLNQQAAMIDFDVKVENADFTLLRTYVIMHDILKRRTRTGAVSQRAKKSDRCG